MRNIWSHDGLFYVIIDDNDDEMAPEDVVNELAMLQAGNICLRQILVDTCNATRGECTADVSLDFLAHLPGEVAATVEENARLTAAHEAAADELARVVQELRAAREALECTFNWAMTEESDPNGGFDIFAEEIVPMIGKVLGRE